jgi:hypothetical protein
VFAEFVTFPEKVEGRKAVPFFEFWHSLPAFPMAILEIYGMLSFKAAGLFRSLYYINNGRLRFLKIIEIFTVFYM